MFTWPRILLFVIMLSAAGIIVLQRAHNQTLQAEAKTLTVQRDGALTKVNTQQWLIGELAKRDQDNRNAYTGLLKNIGTAKSLLQKQEQTIISLERENEALKTWSHTALPEPVVRLRQRPAITGSAAYRKWLSERDAMSTAGHPSGDEWRPAPRP